jgi:hypothetical protein
MSETQEEQQQRRDDFNKLMEECRIRHEEHPKWIERCRVIDEQCDRLRIILKDQAMRLQRLSDRLEKQERLRLRELKTEEHSTSKS